MIDNLSANNIAYIFAGALMLLMLIYNLSRSNNAKYIIYNVGIWLIIILAIVVFYAFRFELTYVAKRTIAVLIPSYSWTNEESNIITIARSPDSHFYIDVIINEQKIHFMIDTGASDISISKKDALKLGFDLSKLNYTKEYSTANGINLAAPVKLNKFKIANMILRDLEANIGLGELDISLLGMSALQNFKSFKIDGDLLILTGF